MKYLNPFRVGFQQPEYAWLACGTLLFVATMALLPIAHIEKFGFLIAMGAGVYHLGVTVKAVASGQKNLAVLLAYAALAMLAMGALGTPKGVLAASAWRISRRPLSAAWASSTRLTSRSNRAPRYRRPLAPAYAARGPFVVSFRGVSSVAGNTSDSGSRP